MDLNNLLSIKILKVQNSQYCQKLWLQLPLPFYYTQYTFVMSVSLFMCLFVSNKDKKRCLELILIVKNLVKKNREICVICVKWPNLKYKNIRILNLSILSSHSLSQGDQNVSRLHKFRTFLLEYKAIAKSAWFNLKDWTTLLKTKYSI